MDNISLKDEDEDRIDFSSQEKDLKNALSAEDEGEVPNEVEGVTPTEDEVKTPSKDPTELSAEEILKSQDEIADARDQEYIDLLLEDYYVHEAVNVLKALKIYQK